MVKKISKWAEPLFSVQPILWAREKLDFLA
jgi:hypothetical protein